METAALGGPVERSAISFQNTTVIEWRGICGAARTGLYSSKPAIEASNTP